MRRSGLLRLAATAGISVAVICAAHVHALATYSLGPRVTPTSGGSASGGEVTLFFTCGLPAAGGCSSEGFHMWCGTINTPVEDSFAAAVLDGRRVMLRWVLSETSNYDGLYVYRVSTLGRERLHDTPIPCHSPGAFEDTTVWPGGSFAYELRGVSQAAAQEVLLGVVQVQLPGELRMALQPSFPNPMSSGTTFLFEIPHAARTVSLAVYNASGRLVRMLVSESQVGGRYSVSWDGLDDAAVPVAPGVYFARLAADGRQANTKVVVLR